MSDTSLTLTVDAATAAAIQGAVDYYLDTFANEDDEPVPGRWHLNRFRDRLMARRMKKALTTKRMEWVEGVRAS